MKACLICEHEERPMMGAELSADHIVFAFRYSIENHQITFPSDPASMGADFYFCNRCVGDLRKLLLPVQQPLPELPKPKTEKRFLSSVERSSVAVGACALFASSMLELGSIDRAVEMSLEIHDAVVALSILKP